MSHRESTFSLPVPKILEAGEGLPIVGEDLPRLVQNVPVEGLAMYLVPQ